MAEEMSELEKTTDPSVDGRLTFVELETLF